MDIHELLKSMGVKRVDPPKKKAKKVNKREKFIEWCISEAETLKKRKNLELKPNSDKNPNLHEQRAWRLIDDGKNVELILKSGNSRVYFEVPDDFSQSPRIETIEADRDHIIKVLISIAKACENKDTKLYIADKKNRQYVEI